jgi:hypothetical protein
MRKLLVVVPLLLLMACSTPPRPAKEAFAKVQLGMTEAQVEQVLGKPASTFVLPDDKAMVNWTYSEKDWVNFNGGQVFAVVYDEKDLLKSVPLDQTNNYARAPLASQSPAAGATATPTAP